MKMGQGTQFISNEWENPAQTAGIKMQQSVVESHNALGVGDIYHAFLRRVYNRARDDSPQIGDDESLASAVNAINNTAGPARLVAKLLVFGVMPRISVFPKDLLDQISRIKAIRDARAEMAKLFTQARLKTATTRNVTGDADADVRIGDRVLLYREKPIEKWAGPFIVRNVEGKLVTPDTSFRTILASIDKFRLLS